MISYHPFRVSLRRLQEQHDNYVHRLDSVPSWIRPAVEESVVRRFQFCHDSLHRVLRRHLMDVVGIAQVGPAPLVIFRHADESDLLDFGRWKTYNDIRVGVANDCSGEEARRCLQIVPEFLSEAVAVYETLTGEAWE